MTAAFCSGVARSQIDHGELSGLIILLMSNLSIGFTSRRAFFTDGEEVYVLGEGDVLLKRFRIIRIGNANLEFEEISTGRIGTAPLEEQAAGPGAPQ